MNLWKLDSQTIYSAVPNDFPRPEAPDNPPVFAEGNYFPCSPIDLFETWQICVDLAFDLSKECFDQKWIRTPLLSEGEILRFHFAKLAQSGWGTDEQVIWIIKRVAHILNWQLPTDIGKVRNI